MIIAITDLETNIRAEVGSFSGSPFWPANGVVVGGIWFDDDEDYSVWSKYDAIENNISAVRKMFGEAAVIVGHNIKFDMLYYRKFFDEEYKDFINRGGLLWDTMVAEYILTGQSEKMHPLGSSYKTMSCGEKVLTREGLGPKYGGTDKDDRIKEYWEAGIQTEDIPMDELLPYLEDDVKNTRIIYYKQCEKALKQEQFNLMLSQMDALVGLIETEWNGMEFDLDLAGKRIESMESDLNRITSTLVSLMQKFLPEGINPKVSAGSTQQLGTILFGGKVKVRTDEPKLDVLGQPLRFKTGKKAGQLKTRKVDIHTELPGSLNPEGYTTKSEKGKWSVTDEVLCKVLDNLSPENLDLRSIVEHVLIHRKLSKDLSTYYVGYSQLVFPDGRIHANYNQALTSTGRLSCSAPNLQNCSNKERDE